jgi:hypothetical protein
MTVSAVSPWRTAFCEACCLRVSVLGPVLPSALRRLASICLTEVMLEARSLNWLRSVIWGCRGGGGTRLDPAYVTTASDGAACESIACAEVRTGRVRPKLPRGSHSVDSFCAPPTGLVADAVQFAIWRRGTRRLSPPQFLDAQFRPQPTETVICDRIVATFGPCRTIFERFKPIGDFDSTFRSSSHRAW